MYFVSRACKIKYCAKFLNEFPVFNFFFFKYGRNLRMKNETFTRPDGSKAAAAANCDVTATGTPVNMELSAPDTCDDRWTEREPNRTGFDSYFERARERARALLVFLVVTARSSSPRGHARRHRGSSASLLPQRSPPLTRRPDLPTSRLVPTRLSTTITTCSILPLCTRDVHLLLHLLPPSKLYYCTTMVSTTCRYRCFC